MELPSDYLSRVAALRAALHGPAMTAEEMAVALSLIERQRWLDHHTGGDFGGDFGDDLLDGMHRDLLASLPVPHMGKGK